MRFVNLFKLVRSTWDGKRAVEKIINNGRDTETSEESQLINTSGSQRDVSSSFYSDGAGFRPRLEGGKKDVLAPANPTTLMRIPAIYAVYALRGGKERIRSSRGCLFQKTMLTGN